jgi:glutathione synthase/RimK-type ligase-like ATP-grasp enzyme
MSAPLDLVVLYEHPEWQKPLFEVLRRRGLSFAPFDLTRAAFSNHDVPRARVYFNQASPSAYLRGHTRAVPFALAYMRSLELLGARVLNGADVFALELSKSTQATLLRTLAIDCPRSITFNDVRGLGDLVADFDWPGVLKPDQGGSGARIQVVGSLAEIEQIFSRDPSIWLPDNLFLLQEYLPLLYAMRVKTHGRFNLCPSPVCNPDEGDSACELPGEPAVAAPPVEFSPFPDVPPDAVRTARRIVQAAGLAVGGIEYLETTGGRRVFYDINANSNLRPSVAAAFGFDPFERVVDYLMTELAG